MQRSWTRYVSAWWVQMFFFLSICFEHGQFLMPVCFNVVSSNRLWRKKNDKRQLMERFCFTFFSKTGPLNFRMFFEKDQGNPGRNVGAKSSPAGAEGEIKTQIIAQQDSTESFNEGLLNFTKKLKHNYPCSAEPVRMLPWYPNRPFSKLLSGCETHAGKFLWKSAHQQDECAADVTN